MARTITIPYRPTEKQWQFHNSKARYRAFIAGIGGGKTTAGANEAIRCLFQDPEGMGMIIAPSYNMLTQATIRTFFHYMPRDLIKKFSKEDYTLTTKLGGTVIFRSFDDPERLRGPNISWFWMDEGSVGYGAEAWNIMVGRLRSGLERGWVTATPRGRNWLWDKFIASGSDMYDVIHATTMENPHLSREYIESLKNTYGENTPFYRQEVLGEFVALTGLVYSEFSESACVKEPKTNTFIRYVGGVDWGYRNPWCFLLIGEDGSGGLYVLDEVYIPEITFVEFEAKVKEILKDKYNLWRIFCDPSRPEFIRQFRLDGIPAIRGKNDILAGIQAVKKRLNEKREDGSPVLWIHPKCKNTIREFQTYSYPESHSDKDANELPLKKDDHAMDALRYAIFGLDMPAPSIRYIRWRHYSVPFR